MQFVDVGTLAAGVPVVWLLAAVGGARSQVAAERLLLLGKLDDESDDDFAVSAGDDVSLAQDNELVKLGKKRDPELLPRRLRERRPLWRRLPGPKRLLRQRLPK